MKIRIRYFALFREIIGHSEETIAVPDTSTVHDVQSILLDRYPGLHAIMQRSVSAVNRRYVPINTLLHEGDELVFIPPTGGGCPSNR